MPVDNRRTMCGHCSLRTDVPPFIDREHATENVRRIQSGDIFKCHMLMIPGEESKRCLGAALISGAELANEPAANQPDVYPSYKTYIETQANARLTNEQLVKGDPWRDSTGRQWFGFWKVSVAGKWGYFLSAPEENATGSAYLFFDQAEELFGPLTKEKRDA